MTDLELIGAARALQANGKQLVLSMNHYGQELKNSAGNLAQMFQVATSGKEAIGAVTQAVSSLEKAAAALNALDSSCGQFIANVES